MSDGNKLVLSDTSLSATASNNAVIDAEGSDFTTKYGNVEITTGTTTTFAFSGFTTETAASVINQITLSASNTTITGLDFSTTIVTTSNNKEGDVYTIDDVSFADSGKY